MAKKLTSTKAKKILHDKSVHGHPLTDKQRKFFGAIAGGAEPYKAQVGTMLTALPSNMMDRLSDALAFPQKAITKLFTGKYETPSEAMNIENPLGAMATDIVLDPLTLMGGGTGASKAAKAVKASTKSGVLSKAYKLNPWAFKPNSEAYYRMIGEKGIDDAVKSGVIRPPQNPSSYKVWDDELQKHLDVQPVKFENAYYKKGVPLDNVVYPEMIKKRGLEKSVSRYKGPQMVEVTGNDELFTNRFPDAPNLGIYSTPKNIPTNTPGVKFYTEDWLRGYKQVKPRKKQDGGWLDKYDAPQAQNGIEGTMGGLTDVGFNYNGAWGGTMQDGGNLIPPMAGANTSVSMAQLGDSVKSIPMQLAMGGSLPGSVGFMYARTQSPAPSNGPYAKKTKASAQNGQEMKYYQEGLDFTPKTISQNGKGIPKKKDVGKLEYEKKYPPIYLNDSKDPRIGGYTEAGNEYRYRKPTKSTLLDKQQPREPITVSDPNDPRLRAYNDSLRLYKAYRMQDKLMGPASKPSNYKFKWNTEELKKGREKRIVKGLEEFGPIAEDFQSEKEQFSEGFNPLTARREDKKLIDYYKSLGFKPSEIMYHSSPDVVSDKIKAIGSYFDGVAQSPVYKKPVQPIILEEEPKFEKPIPIPRDTRDLGYTLPTPGQFTAPELYKYNPDTPTKFNFTYPTGEYNQQKTMYFPSKSALKSFTEGVRGATYQEGADYATATGNLQDGGDIPVDPMGYWNPENIGRAVIIPSNIITMEGVDQPLLGISDTGDVQYMEPGEDYEFDGEYVTEYPIAKGGVSVNDADAQPVKKLDQLLNFTNYNKPTKGGWLDKYN